LLRVKRVYEGREKSDGFRILVDRLWPRGLSKERAAVDLWLRDIAPSDALRKWFTHNPARWYGFKERYFKELDGSKIVQTVIDKHGESRTVTLLFGARDEKHNNALALREYLMKRFNL
jgi:uncharacterized protein YeaO (DUF488 family)